MAQYSPDFTLDVEGIKGVCPAGEVYAKQTIAEKKIPVFSCEGPCIRGDIARLAANMVAHDVPSFARACHAETFLVPHSSMTRWVKGAEKAIMIDGCFLTCHGRIFNDYLGSYPTLNVMFKLTDIEFLLGNYKLEQISDGDNSDHFCIFDYGQMTHTLFGHQSHAEFDRLFWPDMDYIPLHNVSNQSTRRRLSFENDIPRIVSLGYDAN